jgi:phage tail sheath protein FI
VYARTDNNKSVAKTPAGVEDGRLSFSIGLERKLEFAEIDILHPYQVNSLVDTPQTGRAVWGGRTLENPPSDFRFVATRRMFNFLKLSIFNSTHGFTFESVGESLQSRVRLSVQSFMTVLFSQGFFAGTTPSQAFDVICDVTNNPPAVEATGTLICDVYVATQVPGEFIVFRIQQKISQTA